ncbi:Protease production enhancer protein [Phaeobacter sp. CECT 5382]|uniref:DNA-binding response regulator n=1 Tax=Phaeobacter sp. CECT 5382 TaxID=1712645 RepID=UPI0006DB94A1|nr:response regulator transcription factor [Phaeobacter sp. CECT 5382]CUH89957.1 Protease production enhancer protein [Phaeobacter sp. CECT 5382]
MKNECSPYPSSVNKTVLIVDDHLLLLEALETVLTKSGYKVTSCSSKKEAIDIINKPHTNFDAILLDVNMPDMVGLQSISEIVHIAIEIPTVLVSANLSRTLVRKTFSIGVRGYIPKTANLNRFQNVLNFVIGGGTYTPPELVISEVENWNIWGLTPVESEVVQNVSHGLSNKMISAEMGMSEASVKMHLRSIFGKMNVTNRTQVALALDETMMNAQP